MHLTGLSELQVGSGEISRYTSSLYITFYHYITSDLTHLAASDCTVQLATSIGASGSCSLHSGLSA